MPIIMYYSRRDIPRVVRLDEFLFSILYAKHLCPTFKRGETGGKVAK